MHLEVGRPIVTFIMSSLWRKLRPVLSDYVDGLFDGSEKEYDQCLSRSTAVYVGNLSFYTTEMQVAALFSRAGPIKQILMGLDKFLNTPCGFCFVVYYTREDAETCVRFLNGLLLDNRPIRTDLDWGGALETRRYGRGKNGGQVRDEHRTTFDADRGGWGKRIRAELASIDAADARKKTKTDDAPKEEEDEAMPSTTETQT